jgi:hypothetical protein
LGQHVSDLLGLLRPKDVMMEAGAKLRLIAWIEKSF